MPKRANQSVSDSLRKWFGADQQEPRPSDQLFERFMRYLPGFAWLKDLSGKFVYVNESMAKAFGVSHDDLIGKSNADTMSSAAARQCDASDAEAATSDVGVRVTEVFRHADGTMHSALVTKFRVAASDGAPTLVGGIAIDITDRIAAEERLRRSEERLRLATSTGKVGVWDWDVASNQIEWTESLYTIHGVAKEDFDGSVESYSKLVHPDDRAMVTKAIQDALEGKTRYDIELRALRPDGEVIWLYTNAEVVVENGKPVRMVGASFDITSRKRTEIALRESEERFAKAFNASPLVLTLSSLSTGKLLEVNDTFCQVTGYTRAEAIGRTTVELGLWINTADREAEMARVRDEGGVRNLEYRFRNRTGDETVGLLSAEKILIGGETHALTVIQDITERAKAQRALRDSEARLRLALRAANAGVWSLNLSSRKTFWSTEFCELLGFEHDTPQTFDVLIARVHSADRSRIATETQRLLSSTAGEFRQEFRIEHPQLGTRWILTLGRLDRDPDDESIHCRGISLDITRLKQVEDELRVEAQRKNEFLATLAHELRNPLAPIRNGLEILRMTQGNAEMALQARSMMERQLRQMVRLIDDLLDLSRISRGKIELKRERVELTSVVQSALEVSRPLIEQAGHQLTLELASDALFVNADTTRLAQVFANILNNAAKYTNNGGHIRVQVRREGGAAVVTIRDNGIGIPVNMLPRVFDMFTQVDRSLEKAQGGLGIGLSIAKQLTEMHAGSIDVNSEGIGRGCEFSVRLPLALSTSASDRVSDAEDGLKRASNLRILVADDNFDAATSLAMMLGLSGNEVRTAHDGLEAVEIAKSFLPHVILLDIGMPRLNGYDACRELRRNEALANCLIVATTGWGQDDDIHRSRDAGFDHHLVKPVEARVLEAVLSREFGQQRRAPN